MDDDWYPQEQPAMPTRPDHFPATGPNSLGRFPARAGARVIDSLIIGVPALMAGATALVLTGQSETATVFPRWASALWFVMAVTYETVMVARWGQTVGKMAMGLKVGRIDNGRRPEWSQAAIRIALPAVSAGLPLQWAMVIYVTFYSTSAWNVMRRGVHDKAAGTIVVSTR